MADASEIILEITIVHGLTIGWRELPIGHRVRI